MATPLVMPLIGIRNISKVNKWMKSEGDCIKEGEIIAELWSPDGDIKFRAPKDGTLLRIIISEKILVHSGSLLGVIGTPGEDLSMIIEPSTPSPSISMARQS